MVHEVDSKPGPLQTEGSGTQSALRGWSVAHPSYGKNGSTAPEGRIDAYYADASIAAFFPSPLNLLLVRG